MNADGLSVAVGQTILKDGSQQIWDFVLVLAKRDNDGTLTTRVLLCHPEWAEPLEIAAVESDAQKMRVQVGSPSLCNVTNYAVTEVR